MRKYFCGRSLHRCLRAISINITLAENERAFEAYFHVFRFKMKTENETSAARKKTCLRNGWLSEKLMVEGNNKHRRISLIIVRTELFPRIRLRSAFPSFFFPSSRASLDLLRLLMFCHDSIYVIDVFFCSLRVFPLFLLAAPIIINWPRQFHQIRL